MAVVRAPAQGWDVAAADAAPRAAADMVQTRSAALWVAASAAALLLLATGRVGAGLAADPWLAGGVVMVPEGLSSPLAHLVSIDANAAPVFLLYPVFLLCRVLAVFGGCFSLLRIAARLAATDAGGLAAGALLIGLIWLVGTPALLSGVASVGGAFTATQAAIALLTLSLALLLDGSPGAGIALLGVVFDAQPEVAVWGVFALAGAFVALVRQGAPAARSWLAGGAFALLLAAPAAMWWAHTGTAGLLPTGAAMGPLLPPPRWLPWTVPLANWVLGACMLATGLAAFSVLGPDANAGRGAFLGLLLVFVCGCVATLLTANPWVLALRPMAADSVLQLFAATAATAVVVRDLRGGTSVLRVALSVAIAASLLLHPYLLPVAALAMLARAAAAHGELLGIERRIRDWNRASLRSVALGAVAVAALAGCALRAGWLPH